MRENIRPRLPTLLMATLEVWLLLLAAAVLMLSGNRPEAASPALCGSEADALALARAMDQFRAAEIAERDMRSNGESYLAAKIGPIPGDQFDAAVARQRDGLRRSQHYLAVAARRCREHALN